MASGRKGEEKMLGKEVEVEREDSRFLSELWHQVTAVWFHYFELTWTGLRLPDYPSTCSMASVTWSSKLLDPMQGR